MIFELSFEGWIKVHQTGKDQADGEGMVLTGEADALGRTFQKEEKAQPKAREGGLGF